MALLGIRSVHYHVTDLPLCTRFFRAFGLAETASATDSVTFTLDEGSTVSLSAATTPRMPEVIWGVDSQSALDALASQFSDRPIERSDRDGTLRLVDDNGWGIGFALFARRAPVSSASASAVNSLGNVQRWNRNRDWYRQARPKLMHHAVIGVPDVDRAVAFYRRIGFRITDIARGNGVFMRCDGRPDHHNLFLQRAPALDWRHVSFGVESIDELMTGANQMQRLGWTSALGIGRHRISSTVFYYMDCPAGGQAEYSADTDYLTDEWQPRLWAPAFGNFHWVGQIPEALRKAPEWDYRVLEDPIPSFSELSR